MDVKELREYRTKLFYDVYNNVVPDRVPILEAISFGCHAENAGEDFLKVQYNLTTETLHKIYDSTLTFSKGDQISLGTQKNAIGLMLSKSSIYCMAANGMIQHPEVSKMDVEDYDALIADPYAFTVDQIRRRSFGMADTDDPVLAILNFMRSYLAEQDFNKLIAEAGNYAAEKYGLYKNPAGTVGTLPVPFDVLADTYRGFTNIVKDIKRCPETVLDAVEALVPYSMYVANRSKAHPLGANGIPTHMPPFMRMKEFEKFYWPTFERLIHLQAQRGQATQIFCESNWERFTDYLSELPMGTRMFMEQGNPQVFKDKLGKKMALGGFYPISLLKNGTKEQCVDKIKELMDIMMPGGNYFFRFDKTALNKADINLENYAAVMEYVLEHGKYENAGQQVTSVTRESTIKPFAQPEKLQSKYFVPFEEWAQDYTIPREDVKEELEEAYNKYSAKSYALLG